MGVKWRWYRGRAASQRLTLACFVGAVVVDDEVEIEVWGHAGVNVPEEAQELLVAMPRLALAMTAWIWLFSSTQSTIALSGGLR